MQVLVTGATGFVGMALVAALRKRCADVRATSRDAVRATKALRGEAATFAWQPATEACPREALAGTDAVIHLLGDNVGDGRWTEAKKRELYESRVASTKNLVRAVEALPTAQRPKTLVCASAVGYFGDRGDEVLREESSAGTGFLAELCVAWEAAAREARALSIRVVSLRYGMILGRDGGPLAKMLTPFRLGLGGPLGPGTQYVPWLHLDDATGLALFAIDCEKADGPLHTTPNPCTNAELTRALGAALGRPAFLRAPAFALKLALGEMSTIVLASQRTVADKAKALGYRFAYEEIGAALRACL